MEIRHLKTSEIKKFRNRLYEKNNKICPILKQEIPSEKAVLDHIHKQRITDDITETSGVVRNVIDRNVNVFLGKIENAYKRFIPKNTIDLATLLRNIANYIENGALIEDNTIFSHPRENGNGDLIKMKRIPFSKKCFNELNAKLKENKKKTISYKKYLDSRIKNLLESYEITF